MKQYLITQLQNIARFILNKFDDKRSIKYFDIITMKYEDALYKSHYYNETQYEDMDHLLWMLCEIRTNKLMSITKKHRWLGYVQGILCAHKVINVNDERNQTRNIFNGD